MTSLLRSISPEKESQDFFLNDHSCSTDILHQKSAGEASSFSS